MTSRYKITLTAVTDKEEDENAFKHTINILYLTFTG